MVTVHEAIRRSLSDQKAGNIIFPSDFRGKGSEDAIKMALSRIAKTGLIKRIAHGIYYKPFIDPVLGELQPSAEAIAENLAERQHIKIRPAGAFALHKLGLTNQVPTKLIYLTDGTPRKLKLSKAIIEFKSTTPKKMALSGAISSLLILALEELDLEHLHPETEHRILHLLEVSDRGELEADLRLAPGKIYDYLQKLLKKLDEHSIFSLIKEIK